MKDAPKEFVKRLRENFNEEEFEKFINKTFLTYNKDLGIYIDKGASYYNGEIKGDTNE